MHQRIVVAVSIVLFALTAIVAGIVTDLHDRFTPLDLGATSAVTLDFRDSGMSDDEALEQLGLLSDRLDLGLVKVAPDLGSNQSGQVFVEVGTQEDFPGEIQRFGDQPVSEIRSSEVLAHSYASGRYLVTGGTARLSEFEAWLEEHRIEDEWSASTLRNTLELLVRQSDFAVGLLAVATLMVSLVLYWLSVRARGRSLRVLAGVPTWRIQYEDLVGFLASVVAAAAVVGAVAVLYVGLAHDWAFVPYYARVFVILSAILILTTLAGALMLSAASWPSAMMLAAREPAVKSLRGGSIVLKVVTFVFVLAAVSPAFAAWTQASDVAAEQSQWKSLSDQVVLSYSLLGAADVDDDGGENVFQQIMPDVGNLVQEAETHDAVALSYTFSTGYPHELDLGPYGYLSLVNQRWLDLMLPSDYIPEQSTSQPDATLIPLSPNDVPTGVREFLGPSMELWARDQVTADEVLSSVMFLRNSGTASIPLSSGGGGDLIFPDDALIVLVPNLYETFNDSFLLSAASSRNLVFTGPGPTQELVARHGLGEYVRVKNVAEEGILFAQFTAYFAWLRAGSLGALFVALGVSAAVGALITAMIQAKRDFPMRLAGKPWLRIVRDRVVREWLVGATLTVLVILIRGLEDSALIAGVATAVLLVSPLTHLLSARWTFINVSLRRL